MGEEKTFEKKMLSRIPFGETKNGTYLLRAPSLSVLELFPGHVLQLNRRHHREYCTSSSPSARRRRRRVRRRPVVVVFEDILVVVACSKAGRNACGRIIRRRRVALRRRTLRDNVGVVTRRPRQSGCRHRGFGGREEDHRGLSFKASLKASALLLKHEGVSPLFFLLPFSSFFV